MLFQPSLQAFYRTVGKEVNERMLVQVHQNGPIALPFAPNLVICADMTDWITGGSVPQALTIRITVSSLTGMANRSRNATAEQSLCRVADQAYDLADPCRSPSMGSGNLRDGFCEELS